MLKKLIVVIARCSLVVDLCRLSSLTSDVACPLSSLTPDVASCPPLCPAGSWQTSLNVTPAAGGLHVCYHRRATDNLQLAVEFEGSLRTNECTTTVGYQLDMQQANLTFRGTWGSCAGRGGFMSAQPGRRAMRHLVRYPMN